MGSKYFFCKKCQMDVYKPLCLQWQKWAREAKRLKKGQEKCLDCDQGRAIAKEFEGRK